MYSAIAYRPAGVDGWLAQTWPRMVFGAAGTGVAKAKRRNGAETRKSSRRRQRIMGGAASNAGA